MGTILCENHLSLIIFLVSLTFLNIFFIPGYFSFSFFTDSFLLLSFRTYFWTIFFSSRILLSLCSSRGLRSWMFLVLWAFWRKAWLALLLLWGLSNVGVVFLNWTKLDLLFVLLKFLGVSIELFADSFFINSLFWGLQLFLLVYLCEFTLILTRLSFSSLPSFCLYW